MIADILKKIERQMKPAPVGIHRQNSFQYKFTEQSGFDDQFKMFPKSMQQRMIAMWYDNGQPDEILYNVERWNPERRPGMGRFEITPVFTKKNTLRPYENFRKVLLNLAAKEL